MSKEYSNSKMYKATIQLCLMEMSRQWRIANNASAVSIAEASVSTERALKELVEAFRELPDDHDGLCPECMGHGHLRNIERCQWAYCDEHKTKWLIGWNVYSEWRNETEAVWEENVAYLSEYREVDPAFSGRGLENRDYNEVADALNGLIG